MCTRTRGTRKRFVNASHVSVAAFVRRHLHNVLDKETVMSRHASRAQTGGPERSRNRGAQSPTLFFHLLSDREEEQRASIPISSL